MEHDTKINAYKILGLNGPVPDAKILSRSKQILKLLQIDEVVTYELDQIGSPLTRNKTLVEGAIQTLQNQRNKMIELFFWFNIRTDIDQQVMKLLGENDTKNAIRIWTNAVAASTTTRIHYQRNLAVLLLNELNKRYDEAYLRDSLGAFKSVIDNRSFANYLFDDLFEIDQLKIGKQVVDDFIRALPLEISDIYTDLYFKTGHPSFIKSPIDIFKVKGAKVKKRVIEPSLKKFHDHANLLLELNVADDMVLSSEERSKIKKTLNEVQDELNFLNNISMGEDGDVRVTRDKVGEAINRICLDLHNKLDLTGYAIDLLVVGERVAGTTVLKSKLKENLRQLREQEAGGAILDPIKTALDAENWRRALDLVKVAIDNPNSGSVKPVLYTFYRISVIKLAQEKLEMGFSTVKREDFAGSVTYFNQALLILDGNYLATELDLQAYNKIKGAIEVNVGRLNQYTLSSMDSIHTSARELFNNVDDEIKKAFFNSLVDAMIYKKASSLVPPKRTPTPSYSGSNTSSSSNGWGNVIGWVIGIFIIISILAECAG